MRMGRWQNWVAASVLLLLAGCGFHLRGDVSLPYQSIYFALPPNSMLAARLTLTLQASKSTRVMDQAQDAEVTFRQLQERREKLIMTVNNLGRVREYQLRMTYVFQLVDRQGRPVSPLNEIVLVRDISYSDAVVLSKEQEELMLWDDMQGDLAQQVLRRLQARPRMQSADEE